MAIHNERLKWMEKLLTERYGHLWRLTCEEASLVLRLINQSGCIIFDCLEPAFMETGKTQALDCQWWMIQHPWRSILGELSLPAPSSKTLRRPLVESTHEGFTCHFDILGLAFWAMNRLEEIDADILDEYQRFPAKESHAVQHGYLERPIVDEWLDMLGQIIQLQWPQITLKRHQFQLLLSHDVDRPSRYGFCSPKTLIRNIGSDMLLRGELSAAVLGPWININTRFGLHPLDKYNTFHWIMDQSDKAGVQSSFYFLCGRTNQHYDADYEVEHPAIRHLIRDIRDRGHLVGLHPSFECYLDPDQIGKEFARLQKVCDQENVRQTVWGGRMHYLRWSHPTTALSWDAAGLDYDSTLGFAEMPGFRCGTAHEYVLYDPTNEIISNLRERPLIFMEQSVLSEKYIGLKSIQDVLGFYEKLKLRCEATGGNMTLLWHNSELYDEERISLYGIFL